jgi:hypothetical protein
MIKATEIMIWGYDIRPNLILTSQNILYFLVF